MDSWFNFDKRIFKHFSYLLMIQMIPLFVISSYLVKEISPHLFNKQMVYYAIAGIAFFVSVFIPWRRILWWFVPIFYLANLGLLIAVEYIGKTILGAQRWIEIPGLGVTIQPSEFMKVAVIMMLGYLISRKPPGEWVWVIFVYQTFYCNCYSLFNHCKRAGSWYCFGLAHHRVRHSVCCRY